MVKRGVFVLLSVTLLASVSGPYAFAQDGGDGIFSPVTASIFVKTAQEISRDDAANIESAKRFLEAAEMLERSSAGMAESILRIGAEACLGQSDYSEKMHGALRAYIGRQYNLELVLSAVRCMLSQLDTRQDREVLLDRLLRQFGRVDNLFASEVAAQLGVLAMEKADMETAQQYLNQAYALNRYNVFAFETLQQVYAMQELAVGHDAYAVHLRTMLDVNPYDLATVLSYAEMLMQFEHFSQAAEVYEYADRVYGHLFPDRPAQPRLYLPLLLSHYHTPNSLRRCLELAERFREETEFDLMLEAIAGRAAATLGRADEARRILEQAAEKAEQMLGQEDLALPIYSEHLAWFYSFILERADHALAWSNQAYAQAPDRPGVRQIFAYALAVNDEYQTAGEIAEPYQQTDPIAALTMALVHRHAGQRQEALDLLRSAIQMAPETFEAQKARSILTDMGAEYHTPPEARKIHDALEEQFRTRIVPFYVEPRQRFSAKLLFGSSDILYGTDFNARLVIENNSSAPLVIQDGAMLGGTIRVDVQVRGDLDRRIANVLTKRVRPNRAIAANEHIFIPLDLQTGQLRRLLASHPQATLDLEFTVYLDPVVHGDGTVENALRGTSPVRGTLHRRRINLTRDFLMQRLDALATGREGQKIQAARLFAGLLAEQESFGRGQADYAYSRVEPSLLVDALRRALTDENWRLRVHTMEALSYMTLSRDFALIQTLSDNLTHSRWPVRFMTTYLLSRLQGSAFDPVLDWKAQYDEHRLTRRLAVALGGKAPAQPVQD